LTFLTSSRTNEKNITRKSQQEILEDEFDRNYTFPVTLPDGTVKRFFKREDLLFFENNYEQKIELRFGYSEQALKAMRNNYGIPSRYPYK